MAHIRRRWPKVRIVLRADSGFAREELMAWCEANGIDHLFGLARNRRLLEQIAAELQAAEAEHKQTGKPARRFKDFTYATLDSRSRSRRVIGKAEHLDKGANPRFIVTSLEECCARTLYEKIYCALARWRTGSRNASSTCSPTAPRPRPWSPISCACGFRRSPMFCCRRCAALRCRAPGWRKPPAAASA